VNKGLKMSYQHIQPTTDDWQGKHKHGGQTLGDKGFA
jgi:hypothetical protein